MSDKNEMNLSGEQVRVLGCLMEKHLATPKNYPLTPNSLTLACNQKSNRHPVMNMEEGKVINVANHLNQQGLVSIDMGERIDKYSHRAPGVYQITREEQAILAMLMLREPLTLSDIKARTEKMVGFESIEKVQQSVEQLMARSTPLVMQLPLAVGQREERFTHLLSGEPDLSTMEVKPARSTSAGGQTKKIAELEQRIARLEEALDMQWQGDQKT